MLDPPTLLGKAVEMDLLYLSTTEWISQTKIINCLFSLIFQKRSVIIVLDYI